MRAVSVFIFFFLLNFLSLHMAEGTRDCGPFTCGEHEFKFPFFQSTKPSSCGLFKMNCTGKIPEIQLVEDGKWYEVTSVSQTNLITITDPRLNQSLTSENCTNLSSFSLPDSPWLNLTTLYKCNNSNSNEENVSTYGNCREESVYYTKTETLGCSAMKAPEIWIPRNNQSTNLTATFSLHITLPTGPKSCFSCHYGGGECKIITGEYQCVGVIKEHNNEKRIKLGLGIGGSILLLIILIVLCIILQRVYRTETDSELLSRGNSKAGVEFSHVFFQVPIFSYKELQEATNNFSKDRLLGDGGFGTVYYGKVQDGREVAVKRLYEHNYRRVEQFMNEIEILTRLHHKNLVSLYGCTSRRSRELLLVYEFIPNGTVADHLHGEPPKPEFLTWPMRMNIAIETASALAYLHASDIIHRDVKTTNILLDSNFSVKVADFGLSRLFPTDVTHVSTAPQGTPGYVDPEYHQCYHLTDKSDVFSFGVVLVELISSKPAVDINRCKSEINLSSLAINKIQNHATHELIDEKLGYNRDEEVKKMTTMVAELAFRCLQQDNAMRPTMEQVVQELKGIERRKDSEVLGEINGGDDEGYLLKDMKFMFSPISVTQQWTSKSTTPNTSA